MAGVVRRDGLRWRKRPVEVEAFRFVEGAFRQIEAWCGGEIIKGDRNRIVGLLIRTLEGQMRADIGDWIIRGVKGEFYPCKPDIFDATYEPADAVPDVPPDPPAADREQLARVMHQARTTVPMCAEDDSESCWPIADALLSSGVLVDAADVRARALEDAADPGALVAAAERGLLTTRDYLLDRAVSEREGTT